MCFVHSRFGCRARGRERIKGALIELEVNKVKQEKQQERRRQKKREPIQRKHAHKK